MDLYLLIGTAPYFCFLVIIFSGLLFRKHPKINNNDISFVSVVIAARNEEDNISYLLKDLINQSADKNCYEVIVANDRSSDKTKKIIEQFSSENSFIKSIHIKNKHEMTPKKYALTKAIEKSEGEIILTTDADCRVPRDWVINMAQLVQNDTGIVIGYSRIKSMKSFLNEFQKIDFLGIMAANGGLLTHGIVCSGSGQNLAYKKKDFQTINGFEPVKDLVSGDDMYLVQSISSIKGAIFNYNPSSFVSTLPKNSFKSYINQRIRWSSNSKQNLSSNPQFFVFLISAFFANCSIMFSFIYFSGVSFFLFLTKFFLEAFIIFIGSRLFLTPVSFLTYIMWNLIQPIYIPIIGVAGLIGKYSWKN
tara:strand:- start:463 stop:1548 length:1086 start_codon:yes stop_codon:yes gene_type:complete